MSAPKKPQPTKINIETKKPAEEKTKTVVNPIEVGPLMFDKSNYTLMIAGIICITLGFALMSGGASTNPEIFDSEEIYSFRRITLAPIMVILGFVIEIYAIFKNKNSTSQE